MNEINDKLNKVFDLALNAFESQRIHAISCEDPKAQAEKMNAAQKLLETALNALKIESQMVIDSKKPPKITSQYNSLNISSPMNRKDALKHAMNSIKTVEMPIEINEEE